MSTHRDPHHHYQSLSSSSSTSSWYHLQSHLHWYLQRSPASTSYCRPSKYNLSKSGRDFSEKYLSLSLCKCIFKIQRFQKRQENEAGWNYYFQMCISWSLPLTVCSVAVSGVCELYRKFSKSRAAQAQAQTDKWILSWQLIIGFQKMFAVKDDFKRGLMQDD